MAMGVADAPAGGSSGGGGGCFVALWGGTPTAERRRVAAAGRPRGGAGRDGGGGAVVGRRRRGGPTGGRRRQSAHEAPLLCRQLPIARVPPPPSSSVPSASSTVDGATAAAAAMPAASPSPMTPPPAAAKAAGAAAGAAAAPAGASSPPPFWAPLSPLPRTTTPPAPPPPSTAPDAYVDGPDPPGGFPGSIPQTIEAALLAGQAAVAAAFVDGVTTVTVELPMGRSRRFWYRMAPAAVVREEVAILAAHFMDMFEGATAGLLLDEELPRLDMERAGLGWLARTGTVGETARREGLRAVRSRGGECAAAEPMAGGGAPAAAVPPAAPAAPAGGLGDSPPLDVLVIAGARPCRAAAVASLVASATDAGTSVVLFNCFLEAEWTPAPPAVLPVYVVRALDKGAALLEGHGADARWDVFGEIAVFQYEAMATAPREWVPTTQAVHAALEAAGARREGISGYWGSLGPGCEAGFWPFQAHVVAMPLLSDGEGGDSGSGGGRGGGVIGSKGAKERPKRFGFF